MSNYAQHIQSTQREQADPRQVKNNAGGFTSQIDPWQQLERWLILGAEGGSYYAGERKLTRDNAKTIQECLKLDSARTVKTIVEVSDAGRAPKNDPAIFALALALSDKVTAREAYAAIPKVCRIGTHLFQLVAMLDALGRGWGRGMRRAIAAWYEGKDPQTLAYQIAKYGQREGWSHRDVLRMAHWKPSESHAAVARYIVAGSDGMAERSVKRGEKVSQYGAQKLPEFLEAFSELKHADEKRTIALIQQHNFTHEMIDTQHKNSTDVWAALLERMPPTALLRNLGKMSAVGLLKPLSGAVSKATVKLCDQEALRKGRVHPITVLTALRQYKKGHGDKGSLTWQPAPQIVDALDDAFYLAFGAIPKSGKNIMIALDVSGSMEWPSSTIKSMGLTAREASAVMAMATVRTEQNYHVMAFASNFMETGITAKQRLDDVIATVSRLPAQSTDCALPMLYAMGNKMDVDVFQVYTDNETHSGSTHPHVALNAYRKQSGRNAKLVVCGMTATEFTIADPKDPGTLDVVGFDSAAPAVIADFACQ